MRPLNKTFSKAQKCVYHTRATTVNPLALTAESTQFCKNANTPSKIHSQTHFHKTKPFHFESITTYADYYIQQITIYNQTNNPEDEKK